MITLLSNKPIRFLRCARWGALKSVIDNMGWEYLWDKKGSDLIVNSISYTDFRNKLKNTQKTELKDGSVLLFSKTSKFPRFKLEGTTFKRCIKIDKADCVVINCLDFTSYDHRYVLEGAENYYIVQEALPTFYGSNNKQYVQEYADDLYNFLKKRPYMFGEKVTPKLIYSDVSIAITKDSNVVYNIMTDKITSTITDDALDKIVSGTLDDINEDAFNSIKEMFDSPDRSTVGLGLRLLAGYNISKASIAVQILLRYNYYKLRDTNEWNSVAVKQLIKYLNFNTVGCSMRSLCVYFSYAPAHDLDKKLCAELLKSYTKKVFSNTINEINDAICKNNIYNFKVSVNVE